MLRCSLLIAVLFLEWGGLDGCGSTNPRPSPDRQGVYVEGNTIVWSSEHPTLGSVRYGFAPGLYEVVAYPRARGRGDKTFSHHHRVPLLSINSGGKVYLQVINRSREDSTFIGEELTFTIPLTNPVPLLSWTMIDVGFGDAHFLTMPKTGKRILVDAGERRDWPNVDAFFKERGIDAVDVVIGTHVHIDHIGGMIGESGSMTDGVLGAYPIGKYLDSPDKSAPRAAYDELLETLASREIPMDVIRTGDMTGVHPGLNWDSAIHVQVLNSGYGRSFGGETDGDFLNNDSIVLRITYGDVSFFMGGDAEGPVEHHLSETLGGELESEILKIHHHGISDASTPGFLDLVNPRVGVIPVSRYESYFHSLPGAGVLGRLRERRIDVYSSDLALPLGRVLMGDAGHHVVIRTDGESYEVSLEPSSSRHYPPSGKDPGQ